MDAREHLMNVARPGEVHSFEVAVDSAPALGVRLRLHPVRRGMADEPEGFDFDLDPDGPWTVFAVRPSDDGSAQVKVLIRRL